MAPQMKQQLNLWGVDEPTKRLRWSVSRHKRLEACARRYYLQHFASRGGHNPDADPLARELFVLKGLGSRYMWAGKVVHSLIELAMGAWARGEQVPAQALVERGTRIMRAQYAESVQGVYRERPMQACGLMEHEFRDAVPRQEWRRMRDLMERCVRNFVDLPLVQTILEIPRWRWLAVESSGSFEIDGALVVVRPDFVWRAEDGRVVVVDWKTGAPRHEDEDLQLAVYGVFARRAWGLGTDHLLGRVAYLNTGEERSLHIGAAQLEQVEARIVDSLQQMRSLEELAADPQNAETHFPMTENRKSCLYCAFRQHCGRKELSVV